MEISPEYSLERGREIGEEMGKEIGKDSLRIEQVCKKLRRSKSAEMIVAELEEDETIIRRICEIAAGFAPEYDSEKVMEVWFKANAD